MALKPSPNSGLLHHHQPPPAPLPFLAHVPTAQEPWALSSRAPGKDRPLRSFLPRVRESGEPRSPNPKETQTLRGRLGTLPHPPQLTALGRFESPLLRTPVLVLRPGGLPIPKPRPGPLPPRPRQRLATIRGKPVTLQIAPPGARVPERGPWEPGCPDPQLEFRCPHRSAWKTPLALAPQAGLDAAAAPPLRSPDPRLGLLRLAAARRQLQAGGAEQAPVQTAPEAGSCRTWSQPAVPSLARGAPVPTLGPPGSRGAPLPARPLRCLRPAAVRVRSPAPRTSGQCAPGHGPEPG